MSENIYKIKFYKFGNVFACFLSVLIGLFLLIKQQPAELILLVIACLVYFAIKSIYYTNVIKDDNYIEIEVKCMGHHHPSIGFGVTNSMVFDFEPVNFDEYKLANNKIELQVATTPRITQKKVEKKPYPYISGQKYLLMFKRPKNGNVYFDNRNFLTSCALSVNKKEKENTPQEEMGKNK